MRALSFALLPLYTRLLSPADFGIIAVTSTVAAVLAIVFPLSMHGAMPRFYFSGQSQIERRQNGGTIWIAMLFSAASLALLLDRFGDIFFPLIFREVPFSPYIRLAIWSAFFNTLSLLPLNLLQIQERPGLYVFITVGGALLNIGLIIGLVVFERQGVLGYLLGLLLAGAFMGIPYLVLALHNVTVIIRWNTLKAILGYSLPLVPHGLAGWVLELSDRVILERYVSLGELGLYAIGYQFGTVMTLIASAINYAWVPFLFKLDAQEGESAKPRLARLVTYYTLALLWTALGLVLLVNELLIVLTAPGYHSAYRIVPWVVGGLLMNGLYFIPVNFLFLKAKTGLVPLVTISSGIVNVGLNLWLVPAYGIMAAAWATFVAYSIMLIMVWIASQRVYPFPFEYKRLGHIALATVMLAVIGSNLRFSSITLETVAHGAVWLSLPVVLAVTGFLTSGEKEQALTFARRTITRRQP